MASLPEGKPIDAAVLQKIMDKILENNNNVTSADYGVYGCKTDEQTG